MRRLNGFRIWLLRWLGGAGQDDVRLLDRRAQQLHEEINLVREASVRHRDNLAGELSRQAEDHRAGQMFVSVQVLKLRQDLDSQKVNADAAIAELIDEINDLRNKMAETPKPEPRPVRRTHQNFRDFRAAIEQPKRIVIERKS